MIIGYYLANVFCVLIPFFSGDIIFYRSPALHDLTLTVREGSFTMLDDNGARVNVTRMTDQQGLLYWYRRIKTPVCLTGECKLVDVGLYWDCTGDFFGIDVYGEHLTKTDHSIFSAADYQKLMDILSNDWSLLREYDFAELTSEAPETEGDRERPDATSGATRKEIASEAVSDAVYTTYTLWHLVHNGEKEQLMDLTIAELKRDSLTDRILESDKNKYTLFLLELFAQSKIDQGGKLTPLIIGSLDVGGDPHLQNVALKSLARLDVNDVSIQDPVAGIYARSPEELRLRILTALKDVSRISDTLYSALEKDVHLDNEWFAIKVLSLLSSASAHSPEVIAGAEKLAKSRNSHIKESAEDFLKGANQTLQNR